MKTTLQLLVTSAIMVVLLVLLYILAEIALQHFFLTIARGR